MQRASNLFKNILYYTSLIIISVIIVLTAIALAALVLLFFVWALFIISSGIGDAIFLLMQQSPDMMAVWKFGISLFGAEPTAENVRITLRFISSFFTWPLLYLFLKKGLGNGKTVYITQAVSGTTSKRR
jgi:hypothetical protein